MPPKIFNHGSRELKISRHKNKSLCAEETSLMFDFPWDFNFSPLIRYLCSYKLILQSLIFLRSINILGKFHFCFFCSKLWKKSVLYQKLIMRGSYVMILLIRAFFLIVRREFVIFQTKIESFHSEGKFLAQTIFKSFDVKIKPDFALSSYVCFLSSPFLDWTFFPSQLWFLNFLITRFPYAQKFSYGLHILFWVNHLKNENLDFGLRKNVCIYDLMTFDSSCIIFWIKPRKNHLVLNTSCDNFWWHKKIFFC